MDRLGESACSFGGQKMGLTCSCFRPRRSASFNVHHERHSNEPWGTWTTTHRKTSRDETSGKDGLKMSGLDDEHKQLSCRASRVGSVYLSFSSPQLSSLMSLSLTHWSPRNPRSAVLLARLRVLADGKATLQ